MERLPAEQKQEFWQPQKQKEEKSLATQKMRQEYYKIFNLSKREVEIANLLYENYSNKQIAEHLFIAVSTVATHIQHIYEKCNVRNRNEWIRLRSGGWDKFMQRTTAKYVLKRIKFAVVMNILVWKNTQLLFS